MIVLNCLVFALMLVVHYLIFRPSITALAFTAVIGGILALIALKLLFIFIFFALFVITLYGLLKSDRDIFSPWSIFSLIWFFAVGVSSLGITVYENPWSDFTWFNVLIAMLFFLAGCFITLSRTKISAGSGADVASIKDRISGWPVSRYLAFIMPLFIASLAAMAYQYRVSGVIPMFGGAAGYTIDTARTVAALNSYLQRAALTQVPIFISINMFLLIKNNIRRYIKISLFLIGIISLIAIATLASRFFLGSAIITSIIIYHYLRNRFKLKQVLIVGILIAIVIVSIPVYIRGILPEKYLESIGFSKAYIWTAPLYLGISMNYFVFDKVVEYVNENGFRYGWLVSYPVRAIFAEKERLDSEIAKYATPGAEWMSATVMGEFYGDFGVVGVALGMLILGFFTSYVYIRMLKRPTPFNVFLHSYNAWNIIYSIYLNGFIMFDYFWNVLVIWLISLFCGKRRAKNA